MSIISISGKKGQGKDTVGKIMQIMIDMPHMTDEAVITFIKRPFPQPTYEIEKFAEPLKQAAAIMMGCKREDLEDENFKNTPLGPEWNHWELVDLKSGKRMRMTHTEEEMRDYIDSIEIFSVAYEMREIQMTPRLFLQLLGTECGREILHPQIWVNALMAKYKPGSNWIITDTRFPNELDAVRKRDCIAIRVEREGVPESNHPSETSLDYVNDWDSIIYNNGSMLDLVKNCRTILTFFNILKYDTK